MVFIVFSMVLLWSSLIFNDFAMVFTALSSVSNGFPCFSIKSYENHWKPMKAMETFCSVNGFCNAFHCSFKGLQWFYIALSRVGNGFHCFFNGFAVVSIARPIVFAIVLLRFHWFCNVFTPLSMVCNGFHCLLNGFTVVFFDFQ